MDRGLLIAMFYRFCPGFFLSPGIKELTQKESKSKLSPIRENLKYSGKLQETPCEFRSKAVKSPFKCSFPQGSAGKVH
jgi:hypothetical protein